jgi:hypothetical protein
MEKKIISSVWDKSIGIVDIFEISMKLVVPIGVLEKNKHEVLLTSCFISLCLRFLCFSCMTSKKTLTEFSYAFYSYRLYLTSQFRLYPHVFSSRIRNMAL